MADPLKPPILLPPRSVQKAAWARPLTRYLSASATRAPCASVPAPRTPLFSYLYNVCPRCREPCVSQRPGWKPGSLRPTVDLVLCVTGQAAHRCIELDRRHGRADVEHLSMITSGFASRPRAPLSSAGRAEPPRSASCYPSGPERSSVGRRGDRRPLGRVGELLRALSARLRSQA